MTDYLTILLTVLSWLLYATFVYQATNSFRQRQQKLGESAVKLGFLLVLWALLAGGVLAYFSFYPVGIAGMVWVAVNIGLMLPLMDQREDGTSLSSGRLLRTAVSMTLLSILFLAIGWPLTVLYPERELYKLIAVLIACIASAMFVFHVAAAWRRWHSQNKQCS